MAGRYVMAAAASKTGGRILVCRYAGWWLEKKTDRRGCRAAKKVDGN